ncbi:prolipoprotein diacylglyceryl transferase [Luteimonas sp. RC10]|uniref:prolipoprotein diacylglyceryl transferase n=1 Tax=Luteimonas sp. RC10 TaxID=2587035 RepID=UPI00161335B8|nr:prolipoprotein diacylglyceryl transferase [Luteimonas sp. RC10]MBB3345081.1 phosphatidylglycerol:prolipoprotein diacylglycerol transferase [Luteimonas sp. RC10]
MIILHQIDPIALQLPQIGPFHPSVHWYGVMYLLGFGMAWWLGRLRIRAGRLPGVDVERFGDLLFNGILGVILGGRIGYVLFYTPGELMADPLMLFKVWDGGMSFHGGLIGVLVAAWWWARRQRLHFFDVMDFVAPLVPPGLGFGRLGNYIGAELWGKYTQAGWGVVFPTDPAFAGWSAERLQAEFATGALDQFARHPSQLYQAGLEGLAMFVILWLFSRKPRARYAVSGMFALLYGVFRILVEFVRVPDANIGYLAFGWVTQGQLLSLPLVALGLFLLWRSRSAPVLQPAVPAQAG